MTIDLLIYDKTQKNKQEADALKTKHRVKFASWSKKNVYLLSPNYKELKQLKI